MAARLVFEGRANSKFILGIYWSALVGGMRQLRKWNMEQMFSRKLTTRLEYSKVDELIIALTNNSYSPECEEAQLLTEAETLHFYFHNLHQLIAHHNLVAAKRFELLNDGLYILLKGQISFMYCGNNNDYQKNAYRGKIYTFRNTSGTCLITQSFSVFQVYLKNCTPLEDCYLLKISEEQAINSKFYEYYNIRKELYDNHYLPSSLQELLNINETSDLFTADLKIHSNFVFKHFTFRQTVALNSVGIISQGKARLKDKKLYQQIQKYGVLIPNTEFQVTSASLEVMYILNNQTLNLKLNCGKSKEESFKKLPGLAKQNRIFYRPKNTKANTTYENMFTKKEKEKREKEITKVSKESQNYSIISSFLCKTNLTYVRKQAAINKHKDKKDKFKNPLVLFNIVNEKNKLSTPSFSHSSSTPALQQNPRHLHSQKQSAIEFDSSSNASILHKLRVPLKDYQKMLKKQGAGMRGQAKARSLFTLTAGKQVRNIMEEDEEEFVRYNES